VRLSQELRIGSTWSCRTRSGSSRLPRLLLLLAKTYMARTSSSEGKVSVAHVNHGFFSLPQTFIYSYLIHLRHAKPVCLSWFSPVTNSDLFPLGAGSCYGYTVDEGWRWRKFRALVRVLSAVVMGGNSLTQASDHRIGWAKAICRKENVQLIHAHFGPMGLYVLPLKCELGIPLVTTFYGYDLAPELQEIPHWHRRRRDLFEEGDLFLAEGPFMRERLVQGGCPSHKIEIQRIAIDVSRMPYRARRLVHNHPTRIVFAGRFCEKKGLLYALDAIRKVWAVNRNIEFRVIGDGELAGKVNQFIRDNALGECVTLTGFLKHTDYLREMESGDVFLHPSIVTNDGDSEGGAPTTILEAQALGMPVVSTQHADIPNVTVPGKSALLVPERDSDSLAEAILGLLKDPGRWEEMGDAGRLFVDRYHNIDKEAPALEEKYMSLIRRNGIARNHHLSTPRMVGTLRSTGRP
jgi:colanic acid/amylovoran biosynthesis glycosyltransferase